MSKIENLFYNGQFLACYEAAKQNKDVQEDKIAERLIQLFAQYEYDKFPVVTKKVVQSVERSNELYGEFDEVEEIRSIKEEEPFSLRIKQLEKDATEAEEEQKAQSFFVQGQLFLMAHHYDESVHCLIHAVKHNPNKAVFYGIAGQTMNRFNWSPFEAMIYIERAIELDPENARWYWNKALILTQLYKDLQQELFLEGALIALESATEYCREDQKSLKNGIDTTVENMKEYLFN
ncbi:O-linked GlcNAc transferase [Solibacillus sp. R5-41]|uniref:tetratricopeptide repeat protein n=1 Tax=Solibacillus sp. R5-41 TaxID=2048654 RepID=UPI000C124B7D|nr:O-linked GlcNAc transferase [Solibacillus sp. R5-41]ATP39542.1 O-linked GlcNAc transferase [Solibacillus sp. R5-41]